MKIGVAKSATGLDLFAFAQSNAAAHKECERQHNLDVQRRPKPDERNYAMRKSIVTVLAAVSLAGMIASPAAAEDVSVVVSYADLNLAAPAGTAALDRRIEAATDKVCEKPSLRDLKAMAE